MIDEVTEIKKSRFEFGEAELRAAELSYGGR
jgi:hypothetical protein